MLYTKQTHPQPLPVKEGRNKLAFTLVELIVVVTILAILATIGFVSYSSYLIGVRDTNRLAQLVSIHDGLTLYSTKNDLPLPDENIEIQTNGTIIAYQGYAGSNTLETIDFTKGGKDPKDDEYFSYYLTKDRKYFQLLGFLEEEAGITSQYFPLLEREGLGVSSALAVDYANRITTVYGKKLGILTEDTTNTPAQEVVAGELNLTSTTTGYTANMTDTVNISGTATNSQLEHLGSIAATGGFTARTCKELLTDNKSYLGKDAVYFLRPESEVIIPVYCDMTTDGGGWTIIAGDGPTALTEALPDIGTTPSSQSGGLVMHFAEYPLDDYATEMRVTNIADASDNYTFDITESFLEDVTLLTSSYGYMYASDTGFSGGLPGPHKGNIALIWTTPGSYPADGEALASTNGSSNVAYGTVAYAWQFRGGGNWFRIGWNTPTDPTKSTQYNASESSYLMIR